MRLGASIFTLISASTLMAAINTAQAATYDIDFTINSAYFTTNGQVSNVSASDFPAKGSAIITSAGSGYQLSSFALQAGRYSFPTDFFSSVNAFSNDGKTVAGFVLSSYAVDYQRTLTFDFSKDHLGSFALVQADPTYASFGCVNCVSATLASGTLPSTVPLPSSVSLLGAALLGLAAVGARAGSRKASAAV